MDTNLYYSSALFIAFLLPCKMTAYVNLWKILCSNKLDKYKNKTKKLEKINYLAMNYYSIPL